MTTDGVRPLVDLLRQVGLEKDHDYIGSPSAIPKDHIFACQSPTCFVP